MTGHGPRITRLEGTIRAALDAGTRTDTGLVLPPAAVAALEGILRERTLPRRQRYAAAYYAACPSCGERMDRASQHCTVCNPPAQRAAHARDVRYPAYRAWWDALEDHR